MPYRRELRSVGVVLAVTDDGEWARVWVPGFTSPDGEWAAWPPGMPDSLRREGTAFEVRHRGDPLGSGEFRAVDVAGMDEDDVLDLDRGISESQ